jgi:hypothetical protein
VLAPAFPVPVIPFSSLDARPILPVYFTIGVAAENDTFPLQRQDLEPIYDIFLISSDAT